MLTTGGSTQDSKNPRFHLLGGICLLLLFAAACLLLQAQAPVLKPLRHEATVLDQGQAHRGLLPRRADTLVREPGGRDVVADLQNPAVRRVSFDKFRAVLKSFRTPGQPFFTWDDIRYLHSLSTTEEFRSFCGD